MRILNAAKSKYYDAALSNFKRARRCYERAGLAAEWADTVRFVRASHRRKTGFMSGFEALVAGAVRGGQPSFLERAKTRWGVGRGRDDWWRREITGQPLRKDVEEAIARLCPDGMVELNADYENSWSFRFQPKPSRAFKGLKGAHLLFEREAEGDPVWWPESDPDGS
jgi:hypothetical protein